MVRTVRSELGRGGGGGEYMSASSEKTRMNTGNERKVKHRKGRWVYEYTGRNWK